MSTQSYLYWRNLGWLTKLKTTIMWPFSVFATVRLSEAREREHTLDMLNLLCSIGPRCVPSINMGWMIVYSTNAWGLKLKNVIVIRKTDLDKLFLFMRLTGRHLLLHESSNRIIFYYEGGKLLYIDLQHNTKNLQLQLIWNYFLKSCTAWWSLIASR